MKASSPLAQADVGSLVTTRAGRIHIHEEGPRNGITPLLLVHAFAGSLHSWDAMIEVLARDRRVLRIDVLGHGGSDKPATGYSIPDQADAICDVLDHLGIDRVLAVGHSGGGDIAVALIEKHSERLTGAILLGTPPNLSFVHLPLKARLFSTPMLGGLLWKLTTGEMVRKSLAMTFAPNFPSVPDVYVRDLERMTHHSYIRARAEVEGYRKFRDLTHRVSGANVPLMIIFGDEDKLVDPTAADVWKRASEARVEILAGVGHTPLAEAPRETAHLILDFARRLIDPFGSADRITAQRLD